MERSTFALCHDTPRHRRKPGNALFMARVEAMSGIRATYYFRRYGYAYRPEIMKVRTIFWQKFGFS